MIGLIALILSIINFIYLILKDKKQNIEVQRKECIDTLKNALKDVLNNKLHFKSHIAYVESLTYLKFVKNNINSKILFIKFAQDISDFCEGSKNEEDLLGSYKDVINSIYIINMKLI